MEPKSKKKRLKCDAWKQCNFESIFNAVFFALASENGAKIQCFSHLYRRRRFCKNHCFPTWASKNLVKIDAKRYQKKNIEKMARKSNFGVHVGLQNPLKSLRKATRNEACFATLWKLPRSRRKATGPIACWASKWLRIWLGLLHPSIDLPLVALIIQVSPATYIFRQTQCP